MASWRQRVINGRSIRSRPSACSTLPCSSRLNQPFTVQCNSLYFSSLLACFRLSSSASSFASLSLSRSLSHPPPPPFPSNLHFVSPPSPAIPFCQFSVSPLLPIGRKNISPVNSSVCGEIAGTTIYSAIACAMIYGLTWRTGRPVRRPVGRADYSVKAKGGSREPPPPHSPPPPPITPTPPPTPPPIQGSL